MPIEGGSRRWWERRPLYGTAAIGIARMRAWPLACRKRHRRHCPPLPARGPKTRLSCVASREDSRHGRVHRARGQRERHRGCYGGNPRMWHPPSRRTPSQSHPRPSLSASQAGRSGSSLRVRGPKRRGLPWIGASAVGAVAALAGSGSADRDQERPSSGDPCTVDAAWGIMLLMPQLEAREVPLHKVFGCGSFRVKAAIKR